MLPIWRKHSSGSAPAPAGAQASPTAASDGILIAGAGLVLGGFLGIIFDKLGLRLHILAGFATFAIGALAGSTELIGRYRDNPAATIMTLPGLLYIVINASISLAAFWLLLSGQLASFVSTPTPGHDQMLYTVLLAGLGSMAFFRTSLFSVRVRDTDIAVGPAVILQVLLRAADRACDRQRAGPRARMVKSIMKGINFKQAKQQLPLYCLALMQNISADEASQMQQAIAALESSALSDEVKAYNLGLLLMLYVGEQVLREAVAVLRNVIVGPGADEPPILSRAATVTLADLKLVVEFCLALDPPGRIDDRDARIDTFAFQATLPEDATAERCIVALLRLRAQFGPDIVSKALDLLAASKAAGLVTRVNQTVSADLFK
jgi:hypothetical protein